MSKWSGCYVLVVANSPPFAVFLICIMSISHVVTVHISRLRLASGFWGGGYQRIQELDSRTSSTKVKPLLFPFAWIGDRFIAVLLYEKDWYLTEQNYCSFECIRY
jgi:hypothetical protein